MGFTLQRGQGLFQTVQRGTGQADNLLAIVDDLYALQTHGVHQHDVTVVVVSVGGGAACQAGVGRLHDHDAIGSDSGLQAAPLFQQRSGPHNGQYLAFTRAMALAVTTRTAVVRQDVRVADNRAQLLQQIRSADGN